MRRDVVVAMWSRPESVDSDSWRAKPPLAASRCSLICFHAPFRSEFSIVMQRKGKGASALSRSLLKRFQEWGRVMMAAAVTFP